MSLSDLTRLAIVGGEVILITGITGSVIKQQRKIFNETKPKKGRKAKQIDRVFKTKKLKPIKLPRLV